MPEQSAPSSTPEINKSSQMPSGSNSQTPIQLPNSPKLLLIVIIVFFIIIPTFLMIISFLPGGIINSFINDVRNKEANNNITDTEFAQQYKPPQVDAREQVVVIGGFVNDDITTENAIGTAVDLYDPMLNAWIQLADTTHKYIDMAATTIGQDIYLFGNIYGAQDSIHAAEKYLPSQNTWVTMTAPSADRDAANWTATTWGQKIYVTSTANDSTTLVAYDPLLDEYLPRSSPPKSVSNCFAYRKEIKCLSPQDPTRLFSYNPDDDTWTDTSIENRQFFSNTNITLPDGVYIPVTNSQNEVMMATFNPETATFKETDISLTYDGNPAGSVAIAKLGTGFVYAGGNESLTSTTKRSKKAMFYDAQYGLQQLSDMRSTHDNAIAVTIPYSTGSIGGSIIGKVTAPPKKNGRNMQIGIYKITSQSEDAGTTWKNVATQHVALDSTYSFYNLDEGVYTIIINGDYTEYTSDGVNRDTFSVNFGSTENINWTVK